jgi:4-hydroxy-3-polyprenylbenzoate decarboxylase
MMTMRSRTFLPLYHLRYHSSSSSPSVPPSSHAPSPAVKMDTVQRKKRIVVAMTGSTGAIYGIRILEVLRELNIETHLVMSRWAEATIKYETDFLPDDIRALASHCYSIKVLYIRNCENIIRIAKL